MTNLNGVALLVLVTIAAIAQIRANEKKLCPAKFRAVSSTSSFCITGKKYKVGEKRGVSDADRKIIVDTHNRLRGSVNPAPKMMLKMHWDDETARLAQNLADRCLLLQHDENMERMVPGKFSTGQNLAYGSLDWASAVQDWYDEITGFDWTTGKSKPGMEAGHFTQVVWATSAAIGCGFAMCEFDGKAGPNYVCNYGPPGNEPNKFEKEDRPYLRGTRGEDCGDSYDPKTGLCDCAGKICLNGGVLDPKTCKCSCKYLGRTIPWVSGDNCQLDCTKNVKDMPGGSCSPYDCKTTAIYDMCPVYCNLCPSDGIKYANGILADTSLPRGTGVCLPLYLKETFGSKYKDILHRQWDEEKLVSLGDGFKLELGDCTWKPGKKWRQKWLERLEKTKPKQTEKKSIKSKTAVKFPEKKPHSKPETPKSMHNSEAHQNWLDVLSEEWKRHLEDIARNWRNRELDNINQYGEPLLTTFGDNSNWEADPNDSHYTVYNHHTKDDFVFEDKNLEDERFPNNLGGYNSDIPFPN